MGHLEPATGDYVFRLTAPFPISCGLLVGDFAHQTRSVLDNLIWALVTHAGHPGVRANAFPIADTESDWSKWTRPGKSDWLQGIPADCRAVINALQPYQRHNPPLSFAQRHPLAILREISNADKHRILPVTAAAHSFDPMSPPNHQVLNPIAVGNQYGQVGRAFTLGGAAYFRGVVLNPDASRTEIMRLRFNVPSEQIGPTVPVRFGDAFQAAIAELRPDTILSSFPTCMRS